MHSEYKKQRLQKVLASAGFGSRRAIERLIIDGRIVVNNTKAELGCLVNHTDNIYVDNEKIHLQSDTQQLLLYHKPVGEICTQFDPMNDAKTVFDNLPKLNYGKWLSIGRLDQNTSGLLLFTTDGEFANQMMHPRYRVEREYHVRVRGVLDENIINKMRDGILVAGINYNFKAVEYLHGSYNNSWYKLVLLEGKNREIRKTLNYFDIAISRIVRVRFGEYALPADLKPGEYMWLDEKMC